MCVIEKHVLRAVCVFARLMVLERKMENQPKVFFLIYYFLFSSRSSWRCDRETHLHQQWAVCVCARAGYVQNGIEKKKSVR